ncbi:MAG: thermonuclease family protein [Betaproteobacteria bacterium]
MQFLIALLAAAAAVSSIGPRSEPLLVRAVLDGDTIEVATVGRVRLLGIDAPEVEHGFDTAAPFGHEARERLTALVLHRWVRLERDGAALDKYNRRLAYVIREDGLFVNAVLVREGLARISARLPLARLDELRRAEAEAQSFRRGMWGDMPDIPPATVRGARRRMTPGRRGRYTRSSRASSRRKRKSPGS